MITPTIPVTGTIREIRDDRILTTTGDERHMYHRRYYRPAPSPQTEVRRHAPRKDETFANLLQLAMRARSYQARHVYTSQYLTMVGRRLLPGREVKHVERTGDQGVRPVWSQT